MVEVLADNGLGTFRATWSGRALLDLLREHGGRLLVTWPVGVGKSVSMDAVAEEAIRSGQHDLVIVLSPTRQIIAERRWVRQPPADVRITVLKPRPAKRCGPVRDTQWEQHEVAGLGLLGRHEICGACTRRRGCPWPDQYGKKLRGVQVIFGTQAHLERDPNFVDQLVKWTGAQRPLVLLDESSFLMVDRRRLINPVDLQRFLEGLRAIRGYERDKMHKKWIYLAELASLAPTQDLRAPEWRMPRITKEWALAVQTEGQRCYGTDYKFLGYDLTQFGASPCHSRERGTQGELGFTAKPLVNTDLVVYSGTVDPGFASYRLGKDLAAPFSDYQFRHTKTTWFNICSRLGARTYFLKNADQVLDFFAGLVARRFAEGCRPLLIAKKCFLGYCASEMTRRLKAPGRPTRVITGNWAKAGLEDPDTLPLINYGMVGTNLFENFDAAYCLTGYYVSEEVLGSLLHDLHPSDRRVPVKISTAGYPPRRSAGALQPSDKVYDTHHLAPQALAQMELDPVLQAVGRVRPFTRPREVVTFQMAEFPGIGLTAEFKTLAAIREYFSIATARQRSRLGNAQAVLQLQRVGKNQRETVLASGLSLRTVKRYWARAHVPIPEGVTTPI